MATILVVDDERPIADTLALILRANGYDSAAVYSGDEALAHVQRRKPDLVISDVVMPGMTGIELAVRLRQAYRCEILLISGNMGVCDSLKLCSESHSFTLLAKPIHPTDLLAHVKVALSTPPMRVETSLAA